MLGHLDVKDPCYFFSSQDTKLSALNMIKDYKYVVFQLLLVAVMGQLLIFNPVRNHYSSPYLNVFKVIKNKVLIKS